MRRLMTACFVTDIYTSRIWKSGIDDGVLHQLHVSAPLGRMTRLSLKRLMRKLDPHCFVGADATVPLKSSEPGSDVRLGRLLA
jgi:hypothetical protein